MLLKNSMLGILCLVAININAQKITQTVRGVIKDQDGKFPLIGANVIIYNGHTVGTTTDVNGNFKFENVEVGHVELKLSYLGYEEKVIPNIVVSSAKEVVLELDMKESLLELEEVRITAQKKKGEVLNEMALISSRSFSVEETKRYAGSFSDPSRMVSSFAGVTENPEGNNDIVVRGNSPKGILWRLEGIDIPNPNHFADEGATGGPINALNSDLLSNSDFYTGAFSPEYGNVLSGVFDIRMRPGNNEKREYTFGLGVLGTDFTVEGPFKKGYAGSYLVNYRFSSLALLDRAGIVDFDGVPRYQDAAFKALLPTKKAGTFSIFGLGGISNIGGDDVNDTEEVIGKYEYGARLGVIGLNHTYPIGQKSYIKTSLSVAGNGSGYKDFELDSLGGFYATGEGDWEKSTLRSAISYSSKINARNRIIAGVTYTHNYYNLYDYYYDEDYGKWVHDFDTKKDGGLAQSYVSWKHRLNNDITIVSGVHANYFSINEELSVEPRIGLKWRLNNRQSINAGYGNHSKHESIITYYAVVQDSIKGEYTPNTKLKMSKANHYVLGYEYRINKNLNAKLELYYQGLYNIPVENIDTSYYSILNSDEGYVYRELTSKGKGKNYGIELTIEKYFANTYYYMLTSSLYNSTYTTLNGTKRNTKFNGNYAVNFLIGKEFNISRNGKKNVLSVNAKMFYSGGRRYIPINLEQSKLEAGSVYDYSKAWNNVLDDVLQFNLAVSYKINKPGVTHEIFLDVINVANNQARLWEYYDSSTMDMEYDTQLSIIPNIMYRIYF